MLPILRSSAPYTAVPSTLSLPIRLPVSLLSIIAMHTLLVGNFGPNQLMQPWFLASRVRLADARSMHDVERQPADLVTLLVGDEHGVVLIPELRHPLEQAPRDHVGGVHRLDIVGEIGAAGIDNSFPAHQIEMIERHVHLALHAPRTEDEDPRILFPVAVERP